MFFFSLWPGPNCPTDRYRHQRIIELLILRGVHKRLTPTIGLDGLRSCLLRLIPPSQTGSIISGSTHACLPHTPPLLLLRGGTTASEQGLPLQSADRALI